MPSVGSVNSQMRKKEIPEDKEPYRNIQTCKKQDKIKKKMRIKQNKLEYA